LTMILAFAAISDPVAHAVIPVMPAATDYSMISPGWFMVVVVVMTILVIALSWFPAKNLLARRQLMNASFNRWHLVNAYGAFGSITRERYEVVVEGTDAAAPGDEANWLPYEFKGKPTDTSRMPGQFAPYHLRLDWLMWFLALGSPDSRWFSVFLQRLLEADRPTLRLLRTDPFHGDRPAWVRARLYLYHFATRAERRAGNVWWVREPAGELVPPVCLPDRTT
ncbi:MAG: lipase maturation factor family protein, partial [Trebonia sp.]